MPNPTRALKNKDRLTLRQRTLVKRIKRQGLKPVVYRRKGNKNKLSVHNPFLDIVRKSKKPIRPKYPHASDTDKQRKLKKGIAKKQSMRTKKIPKSLKNLFFP